LSIVDQALLSALSLAISLALIKFATPQSLGNFAVASSMTFLALGVQNALVITPAAVRIYGVATEEHAQIVADLATFDTLLNAGLTLVAFLFGLAVGFSPLQAAAAAVFLGSSLIRELARGLLMGDGDAPRCVLLDAAYVFVGSVCVSLLWRGVAPEVACLVGLAAGNLLASAALAPPFHRQFRRMTRHLAAYPAYWTETRWMLVGAGATELHERSYVFLLQLLRGASTVGAIHAGRVLVSPLSLLTGAWGRAMRPRMAALLRQDDRAGARRLLAVGMIALLAATLAYIAAVAGLWSVIERHLFDGRYENMWPVVAAWCGYGLVSVPANCLSFYFQAERRFMPLATNAVAGGLGSLACMMSLNWPIPSFVAILCLYVAVGVALAAQIKWWLAEPTTMDAAP
jgi:O-antigen/teichoic acid export membrane protein